jgi:hypothetical protein
MRFTVWPQTFAQPSSTEKNQQVASRNVAEIGKKLPNIYFFDFLEKVSFFTYKNVLGLFHDLKNVKIAKIREV